MLTVAFVCHKENNNNHENNVEWKTFIYIFFNAKQYNYVEHVHML